MNDEKVDSALGGGGGLLVIFFCDVQDLWSKKKKKKKIRPLGLFFRGFLPRMSTYNEGYVMMHHHQPPLCQGHEIFVSPMKMNRATVRLNRPSAMCLWPLCAHKSPICIDDSSRPVDLFKQLANMATV